MKQLLPIILIVALVVVASGCTDQTQPEQNNENLEVGCVRGPNPVWIKCEIVQKGFFLNRSSGNCEYYEGNGCSELFDTLAECESKCQ